MVGSAKLTVLIIYNILAYDDFMFNHGAAQSRSGISLFCITGQICARSGPFWSVVAWSLLGLVSYIFII